MPSGEQHVSTVSEYSPAECLFFSRRVSVHIACICLCICLENKYPLLLAAHAKVEELFDNLTAAESSTGNGMTSA